MEEKMTCLPQWEGEALAQMPTVWRQILEESNFWSVEWLRRQWCLPSNVASERMEKVSKNSAGTRAAGRTHYTETPYFSEKDLSPWKWVESTWPHSLPGPTASVPAGITPQYPAIAYVKTNSKRNKDNFCLSWCFYYCNKTLTKSSQRRKGFV